MKHIKYLFLWLVMLCALTIRAQEFNPDNPPEPAATYLLTVKANPAEAATVKGTGRYGVNQRVSLQATAASVAWKFVNWTKDDGTEVNRSTSFWYTTSNVAETLTANFEKVKVSSVTLSTSLDNCANLYGAGTYEVGKKVSISCNVYSNYQFKYWTDSDGNKLSDLRNFDYVVPDKDVQLVAHVKYSPHSPGEPSETKVKYNVFLKVLPSETGNFANGSKIQLEEGESVNVKVNNYQNWSFVQFEKDGIVISKENPYTLVMGKDDVSIVARMRYTPGNPGEPAAGTDSVYTLYGMEQEIAKGQTLMYPVYLENTGVVKSLNFTLQLPLGFSLDEEKAALSTSRASAYQLRTVLESENDKGKLYRFEVTGGTQISGHNGILLYLPLVAGKELVPGAYPLHFVEGAVTVGETLRNMTFRSGRLVVSQLDESGLRAQFTVDSYLNRVQFTNHSTEEAHTFLWDFGDGMSSEERHPYHIYKEQGGLFNVKLTARGIMAENVAEQIININPSNTWSASGDYTLNPHKQEVRNFKNMGEMVALFSKCKVDGDIRLALQGEKEFTLDLNSAALQQDFVKWADTLQCSGYTVILSGDQGKKVQLNLLLPENFDVRQKVMEWCKNLQLNQVQVSVNGVLLDCSVLNVPAEQRVCTATATELMAYSSISSDSRVTVTWEAIVKPGCQLSGYAVSGNGDIHEMTIVNAGNTIDQVVYIVMFSLDNQALYKTHYTIYVKPSMQNSSISYFSPSNQRELSGSAQTLDWNDVVNAIGYRVEVKRIENNVVVEDFANIELEANTSYCKLEGLMSGSEYAWQVFALGECDELAGEIRTFTIAKQSDLFVQKVDVVDAAKGLSTIQIKATVANIGSGVTFHDSWTDAIYVSENPDDFAHSAHIADVSHRGALEPGESYDVTFEVKTPDVKQKVAYYYVKTDKYNTESSEESEVNNVSAGMKVLLVDNFMNTADYESLKVLYDATNGPGWKRPWNISSNAISEGHWPGVVFDNDGNVTEISLTDNQLRGELPLEGFVLPKLRKLVLDRNQLQGDVSLFVKECTGLESLNLEDNMLSQLSEPLSATITNLHLGYQHAHNGRHLLSLQNWNMAEVLSNVELTDLQKYDHEYLNFYNQPNLDLYSQASNSYLGSLRNIDGEYKLQLSGDYKELSGAELVVRVAEGIAYKSCLRATLNYQAGDANADGKVSILDAQQTLNRILGRVEGNFNFAAADTWTDCIINVQDIVKIINLFVERKPEPAVIIHPLGMQKVVGNLFVKDSRVVLNTAQPVAAMDILLSGSTADQVSLLLPSDQFQIVARNVVGGVRIVIFSPTGDAVPSGESILLAMDPNAEIVSVDCADLAARTMAIGIGTSETTGMINQAIEDIHMRVEGNQLLIESPEMLQEFTVTLYAPDGRQIVGKRVGKSALYQIKLDLPVDFVGVGIVVLKAKGHSSVLRKIVIK